VQRAAPDQLTAHPERKAERLEIGAARNACGGKSEAHAQGLAACGLVSGFSCPDGSGPLKLAVDANYQPRLTANIQTLNTSFFRSNEAEVQAALERFLSNLDMQNPVSNIPLTCSVGCYGESDF
jgi:hypothetical protein